ncbi:hypothetical protein D046_5362B, partial [Vibrio parahaemolyticus V-223/04]
TSPGLSDCFAKRVTPDTWLSETNLGFCTGKGVTESFVAMCLLIVH